jgi:hypothetical protein
VNTPFEMLFVPPPERFSVAEKVPLAGVPPAPSAELIVKEQVLAKVGVEPCWELKVPLTFPETPHE